jgi:peptidoglycan/LPS O-acetylase OafA/YrhL
MTIELSLYLDAIRFSAAMVVFLGHLSGQRMTGGFLWQFGGFMDNAVISFFVLSGFVIAYAADQRERTAKSYATSRFVRIYSVVVPALLLTFLLDAIGRELKPQLYNATWGYVGSHRIDQFLSSLSFTGQMWYGDVLPGSALPFWSLDYEVWYYVVFGLALFAPKKWRWVAASVPLLLAGPKIALLFPLWLLGAATYRVCRDSPRSEMTGAALWTGSIAVFVVYTYALRHGCLPFTPKGTADRYVVAIIFATNLLGVRSLLPLFSFLRTFSRPIRWCAGVTFTLYLIHLPVAQFLSTLTPFPPASPISRIFVIGGTLIVVFVIGALTERKKDVLRRALLRLLPDTPAVRTPVGR